MSVPRIALFSALAAALLISAPAPAQAPAPVQVRLELSEDFFYADQPLWVRITVRNDGLESVKNPVGADLFKGFQVQAHGASPSKASGKPSAAEPTRPAEMAPQSFYGAVVDLGEIFPDLRKPGTYRIHWKNNGLLSEQLTVQVIPRFDPTKEYEAEIRTDAGAIRLELLASEAPVTVKAFVDMANAGFYDGLQIHEIRPDSLIAGGNAGFAQDARPRRPVIYPAEFTNLPLVAGSVVMKPVGASPASNGSEFIILLRPLQGMAGQVTGFAHVVQGLDIAQAISRRPSSGQTTRPFFKPTPEITIRNIWITEKAAETSPGSESGSGGR